MYVYEEEICILFKSMCWEYVKCIDVVVIILRHCRSS